MKTQKPILKLFIITGIAFLFSTYQVAAETKRDNSKINKRDQSVTEPTASDQSLDKSDTELTRKIRAEIVRNPNLSTYAKNVKIISDAGLVTLKGPVRSQTEKNTIEDIALRIAGQYKVVNQLELVQME